MQCDILTSEAAISALASEWDMLERRSGGGIFSAYEWFRGWWQHLGKPAGFHPHIVTARREGRLVGLAPMAVVRRKGVRLLEWAGSAVADYSDFLLEDPLDACDLWSVICKSPYYDVARIREVRPDALCLPALQAFASATQECPARHTRIIWPNFDAWLTSLSYSARKQYRARIKQAEAIGPLRYDVLRAQVPDALVAMLVAQKSAWANALGKRGIFEAPGVEGFFQDMVKAEAARGRLHFSTLTCNGQVIALHLGFVDKDTFLSYMPSYNQGWSAISPGKLLMFKCMGGAIDNGFAEYDFLRGDEAYKNMFATHTRVLSDFVFSRTLRGRLAQFVYLRRR